MISPSRIASLTGSSCPDPIAQLLEPLEDVPALGSEVASLPSDVEEAAVVVVLRLEQPAGIVKGFPAG